MDSTEAVELRFLIFGILGMFGLALAIVFFVVIYQRKLFRQQRKLEEERLTYQKELLQATLDVQEKERVRIGRELHDGIGSMLSTVRLYLQQIQHVPDPEAQKASMEKADNVLIETSENLQGIVRDLVPTVLHQLGIGPALEALCDVVQQNSSLEIAVDVSASLTLPEKLSLNIYRIVQELLNNTLKHAQASEVHVSFASHGDNLSLFYRDNGKGMPEKRRVWGLGIKNIESRLSLLEGEMNIQSKENEGTQFQIHIPKP